GVVNVCMPYTSRDELARAFELIRKGREKGLLEEDQISEWLISRCLDSRLGTDPNMLIRTSGEKRLSDFLLWQEIQRNQAAREPSTDEQIALQPFLDYVDELHNATLQEYASLEGYILFVP
ncbi:hypothetical protein ANCDUO_19792, partial [Ancylostoma duodenale]